MYNSLIGKKSFKNKKYREQINQYLEKQVEFDIDKINDVAEIWIYY